MMQAKMMMKKSLIAAALIVAAGSALAQAASAPAIAPAKLALINKLIQIQQPGIETIAKGIVQQMLAGIAQGANQALQQQPADKREALAKSIKAEMDKFARDYHDPLYRLPMTFIEIFPVGVLVSLVTAALLRNSRFLALRRA